MEITTHYDIAIILPTRGLLFTEVLSSLLQELQDIAKIVSYEIFTTKDKPIPDCLNYLIDEAQKKPFTHYLFIEEDTVIPKGALVEMLHTSFMNGEKNVVAVDYPLKNGASSIWTKGEKIVFCGFGCTLITSKVFDDLRKPYFRSDKELVQFGDETRWMDSKKEGYGKHDIYFFSTLTCPIIKLEGYEAKHLKVVRYGEQDTNNGLHEIGLKADKITQRYTL